MAKKDDKDKLSEDDRALWQRAMKDARPLAGRDSHRVKTPTTPAAGLKQAQADPHAPKAAHKPPIRPATPPSQKPAPLLGHGTIAGMDKRQASRKTASASTVMPTDL